MTAVIRHGTTMEEIVAAAGVIEERGFTIYDDLMHGFGGGYFPPVVGSAAVPPGRCRSMTLEENMTVVVQPNVDHAGPEGRRAGRRAGARDTARLRAPAYRAARLLPRRRGQGRGGFLPDVSSEGSKNLR